MQLSKNRRHLDLIYFRSYGGRMITVECVVCGKTHEDSYYMAHGKCWRSLPWGAADEIHTLCYHAFKEGKPLEFNRSKFLSKYNIKKERRKR
jgi:hypothetical protein